MQNLNWYGLFYWLNVADGAMIFFLIFAILFSIVLVICTIAYLANTDDDEIDNRRTATKWMWWSWPFTLLLWGLWVFTPSSRDSLLTITGGGIMTYMTQDSTNQKIPVELNKFLTTEMQKLESDEDRIIFNAKTQDEKHEAYRIENMSHWDVIVKMKEDPDFAALILSDRVIMVED